jgi:hypothetical protein
VVSLLCWGDSGIARVRFSGRVAAFMLASSSEFRNLPPDQSILARKTGR